MHIRARKRRRRRAAAAVVFSSRLCALTIYASAILSSFRSALLARESLDRTIFFLLFFLPNRLECLYWIFLLFRNYAATTMNGLKDR